MQLPGSSVHGIFQARVTEWVAISFSRGSSRPRARTQVSRIAGRPSELYLQTEVCKICLFIAFIFHFSFVLRPPLTRPLNFLQVGLLFSLWLFLKRMEGREVTLGLKMLVNMGILSQPSSFHTSFYGETFIPSGPHVPDHGLLWAQLSASSRNFLGTEGPPTVPIWGIWGPRGWWSCLNLLLCPIWGRSTQCSGQCFDSNELILLTCCLTQIARILRVFVSVFIRDIDL